MKNLPIGLQTFSKLITGNYLYVDKTKYIYNLVAEGGQYYFLARPRRFGKSLLLSTLYEIFSGNQELFKGLWIEDKIQWQKHPLIHIDFTALEYETPELLKRSIEETLEKIGKEYGVRLTSVSYKTRFAELIEKLSPQGRVVILIDEYDKPIIDKIQQQETCPGNRNILKEFYSVIKSSDRYVKFAFLTGVSKFSRVSVFSGLNNLNDITLDEKYAAMLGYTEEELRRYFPVLDAEEERLDKVRYWYNGYSWDGRHFVYNPLSILLYFEKNAFNNYWFTTGTPTFLVEMIKEKGIPVAEIEHIEADNTIFESFDIDNIELTSLLFQTGYLTIKKKTVTGDETIYHLAYPNREVQESFLKHLLKGFTQKQWVENLKFLRKLKASLDRNDLEAFFDTIEAMFASIPYNIFLQHREAYYHTVIYLLLRLADIDVGVETETNIGRLDAVAKTDTHVYIMEFKIGTSEEALQQIKEKKYGQPYSDSGKEVVLVGIGIDPAKRNIASHQIETYIS
jgi:hypothetical protein